MDLDLSKRKSSSLLSKFEAQSSSSGLLQRYLSLEEGRVTGLESPSESAQASCCFLPLSELPFSSGSAYRYAHAGRLRIVKLGRRAGVLIHDWAEFLESLPAVGREPSIRHRKATAERWRKVREQEAS